MSLFLTKLAKVNGKAKTGVKNVFTGDSVTLPIVADNLDAEALITEATITGVTAKAATVAVGELEFSRSVKTDAGSDAGAIMAALFGIDLPTLSEKMDASRAAAEKKASKKPAKDADATK